LHQCCHGLDVKREIGGRQDRRKGRKKKIGTKKEKKAKKGKKRSREKEKQRHKKETNREAEKRRKVERKKERREEKKGGNCTVERKLIGKGPTTCNANLMQIIAFFVSSKVVSSLV
jgi:hypothetical protein